MVPDDSNAEESHAALLHSRLLPPRTSGGKTVMQRMVAEDDVLPRQRRIEFKGPSLALMVRPGNGNSSR